MTVGQIERKTQNRVVKLFQEKLGYTYLGNWEEREDNSNIEQEQLTKFLKAKYSDELIKKTISKIEKVATDQNKSLYDINKEIYSMLRYGVQVKENVGEENKTHSKRCRIYLFYTLVSDDNGQILLDPKLGPNN